MSGHIEYSIQCKLEKPYSGAVVSGVSFQTTWLPEKYAELGRVLELMDANGKWEDGWVVTSVGPNKVESKYINERSQDYKKTRNASDV